MLFRTFRRPHSPFSLRLLACAALLAALAPAAGATRSPYDWALVRLDYAREEKVVQLKGYAERMHRLAGRAASDDQISAFFNMNLQIAEARRAGESVPAELTESVDALRKKFDRYYIENYFAFYDMLCIDRKGRIFYTMRKEKDIGDDLGRGAAAESPLGRRIAAKPDGETFVDFHRHGPSSEPAAFFVEPVRVDGEPAGWIALQCAVNKLNSLFASTEDLGATGETFLVNEAGFMLTESHFEGDSTILEKRLADRNVRTKFSEEQGHLTVTDYRGAEALSSFQVFEFLGARWLVVAKIDKDEVTTDHYARHARWYGEALVERLRAEPPQDARAPAAGPGGNAVRVDMDEFLKARPDERIETWGVATCTALLAAYPGRFAYLAHVTPKDRLYGGNETNLFGQMAKKIESFDVTPSEKHGLRFVVVAPHLDSLASVVQAIVEEGFLLSQISVLTDPDAASAAVSYDCADDALEVVWTPKEKGAAPRAQGFDDAAEVGTLVERMIKGDEPGIGAPTLTER